MAADSSPVRFADRIHCSPREPDKSETASHLHDQSLPARERCTLSWCFRLEELHQSHGRVWLQRHHRPIHCELCQRDPLLAERRLRHHFCVSIALFFSLSRSESPQNSAYSVESVPDIPRPSLLQLNNRRIPIHPTDALSPLPAPAQNTRPQETVFHLTPSRTAASQEAPRVPTLFTPPHPRTPAGSVGSALHTPPLEPREYHEDMAASLLQRPPSMLFLNPPAAPLLHPLAVPVYEPVQVIYPIRTPRYIAKVSLLGNTLGKIVSKIRIPGRRRRRVGRRKRDGVFLANLSKQWFHFNVVSYS